MTTMPPGYELRPNKSMEHVFHLHWGDERLRPAGGPPPAYDKNGHRPGSDSDSDAWLAAWQHLGWRATPSAEAGRLLAYSTLDFRHVVSLDGDWASPVPGDDPLVAVRRLLRRAAGLPHVSDSMFAMDQAMADELALSGLHYETFVERRWVSYGGIELGPARDVKDAVHVVIGHTMRQAIQDKAVQAVCAREGLGPLTVKRSKQGSSIHAGAKMLMFLDYGGVNKRVVACSNPAIPGSVPALVPDATIPGLVYALVKIMSGRT